MTVARQRGGESLEKHLSKLVKKRFLMAVEDIGINNDVAFTLIKPLGLSWPTVWLLTPCVSGQRIVPRNP